VSRPLVIIPTYDERENIRDILQHVFRLRPAFDVLVVDDGSPDGTGDIVEAMRAEFPGRLHLMRRSGKLGLGTAYIAGFTWALERHYDHVIEMDADFSHDPNDLPRLLAACESPGVGMSVGSRYVKGGRVRDWSWHRIAISWSASLYVRLVLGIGVRDTTAGFVCYTRDTLAALPLDEIRFVGYAFQIEMKYRVHTLGRRIVEIPITFIDRVKGRSKMSMGIFHEAFLGVITMRLRIRSKA
jgi:dolichol-phosphate mannosyltransferase